ncbi:hypothetical protein [Acidithiobacillus sp.]|jgi:hypothetical protein|uniref:hypothetical protein n=1 Tax=Acidithiobacillus sp. TaxID=1872118 RepID=UPI0025C28B15|nr:hypothetical protein [Acidithiobacillus sp.]MCK9189493.1 hypothetical protein [Acidithiobacillus sp.]MCK9359230.1 hypothetical protein [Acidithiobacillus sp.]
MSLQDNEEKAVEREERLKESKEVEFYSQGMAAWFGTALEHDKSLLTLSVAGIGVLVSVMQTAIDSVASFLLYVGAIFAFMLCLVFVLMIFRRNKKHIIDVFNRQITADPFLVVLDSAASCSFFIAMLLSAALGISSAINTFSDKGNEMSNDKTKSTSKPVAAYDGFNDVGKLKPVSESFNQMAKLKNSFQAMTQLQSQTQARQVPHQVSQVAPCPAQTQTVRDKLGKTGN